MQHTEGRNYFSVLIKLSTSITYTEEEIWELEMHFSVSNCYTLSSCFTWGILPSPLLSRRYESGLFVVLG